MDLALMICIVSFRTGPVFEFFRCSNDFMLQKVYFSRLMRVYVGLIVLALIFVIPANHNPPANGKQGPIPEQMSQTLLTIKKQGNLD
jgi:hypothetical protein